MNQAPAQRENMAMIKTILIICQKQNSSLTIILMGKTRECIEREVNMTTTKKLKKLQVFKGKSLSLSVQLFLNR